MCSSDYCPGDTTGNSLPEAKPQLPGAGRARANVDPATAAALLGHDHAAENAPVLLKDTSYARFVIALLAAMQQHDVSRKCPTTAFGDLPHRIERLLVG